MPVSSDKMFYEMMIPHHQAAIDMSQLVDASTEHAELKQRASDIVTAQKAEMKKYEELVKQ